MLRAAMGWQDLTRRLADRQVQWTLALIALGIWLVGWWQVGHGPLSLGPHRWDDFRYASRAIEGAFDSGVRNRYVHIWGLRAFFLAIDDRSLAAASYGIATALGLVVIAFAFGVRTAGLRCGLVAAGLCPFFPPILRYFSAPMSDVPSALYAGIALLLALRYGQARRQLGWVVAAGALCFASAKAKETGVAVVPVVLWILCQRGFGLRPVAGFVGGLLLGQLALCGLDGLICNDAWQSLRPEHHQNYAKLIASDPTMSRSSPNHMRHGWVELLMARDVRGFSLCAGLGLAMGVRRNRTLFALALWAVSGLLFSAWVSFRYSGIDARVRYLAPLAVPLAVASAYLLTELFRKPPSHEGSDDGTVEDGSKRPGVLWADGAVYLGGVVLVCWLVLRGLHGGSLALFSEETNYPALRASYFLLPLVVPICLFVAWTTRSAVIRRSMLVPIVVAMCLQPVPEARRYVAQYRKDMAGWKEMAAHMEARGIDRVARFGVSHGQLEPKLIRWRMRSLAHLGTVQQRQIRDVAQVTHSELLITHTAQRSKVTVPGLKVVTELRLARGRFLVWDREDREDR